MAIARVGARRGASTGASSPPHAAGADDPRRAPGLRAGRIDERIGQVLAGRYRLLAPIGTGASASVFLADDVTLRRRVAVKLLHPALADDEAFLRRFRAEAQAAAALNHPHVMSVYDWNGEHETPFLVMEYLEGGSLRALLDSGARLSPSQALMVGLETARGLDYAHRRGFVHRDVKPANLLFDDEARVRIADFGLARALAEAAWTEPMGAVLGTARYASPEQARGEALDGRSDVYSLAIVLIEAVTGLVPLAVDTTIGTLMARVDRDLPVPDGLGPLQPVLEAAGRCHPRDRLDAAELGAALLVAAEGLDRPEPLPLAGAMADGAVIAVDRDPTEVQGAPGSSAATGSSAASGSGRTGIVVAGAAAGAAVAVEAVEDVVGAGGAGEPTGRRARRRARQAARRGGSEPAAEVEPHWAEHLDTGAATTGPVAVVAPGEAPPSGGPVLYDVDLDSDLGFGTGPQPVVDLRHPAHGAGAYDLVEPDDDLDDGRRFEVDHADALDHGDALDRADALDHGDPLERLDEPAGRAGRRQRKAAAKAVARDDKAAAKAATRQAEAEAAQAKAEAKAAKKAARAPRRWRRRLVAVVVVVAVAGAAVGYWWVELRIPRYEVPNLANRDLPLATDLAATNGWRLETRDDRRDGTRPGEILGQAPAPGTELERDGTLSLVVSLGNTLVAVPTDLVGVTQEEAGRRLGAGGLALGDVTTLYDEQIPEGTVMALGPGVAPELPKGSGVPLVVSKGPEPRTIPTGLAGIPAESAVATLRELGLAPTQVQQFSDTVPVGQSMGTDPGPGVVVPKGSAVTVAVSKGPRLVTVPNTAGLSVVDAAARLEGAGLVVAGTSGSPTQKVTGTSPAGGSQVRPGTTVTITTGG